MVRCKKLFISVISILLLNSIALNAYALPDVSHNYYDEDKLLDRTWYKTNCINKNPTCQKHILRYESVNDFINYLEKKSKNTNSQKFSILLKRYSETTAITVTGAATVAIFLKVIFSCKNIHSLLALVATGGLIYVAQPIRNFFSYICGSIPRAVDYLKKKLLNEKLTIDEKGLLTKLINLLLGNNDENILALDTDREIYKEILESLKNKISNKEYLNNDILIVSWDNNPKDPSFSIKFDITDYSMEYNKDKQMYFER